MEPNEVDDDDVHKDPDPDPERSRLLAAVDKVMPPAGLPPELKFMESSFVVPSPSFKLRSGSLVRELTFRPANGEKKPNRMNLCELMKRLGVTEEQAVRRRDEIVAEMDPTDPNISTTSVLRLIADYRAKVADLLNKETWEHMTEFQRKQAVDRVQNRMERRAKRAAGIEDSQTRFCRPIKREHAEDTVQAALEKEGFVVKDPSKRTSTRCNPRTDIIWVYNNLDNLAVTIDDAPSTGAYYYLTSIRSDPDLRTDFYKSVFPKVLPTKADSAKEEEAEADTQVQDQFIGRMIGLRDKAKRNPPPGPEDEKGN